MATITNPKGSWSSACDSYGKVQHSRKYDCVYTNVKGTGGDRLVTIAARIENHQDAKTIAAVPLMLDYLRKRADLEQDAAAQIILAAIESNWANALEDAREKLATLDEGYACSFCTHKFPVLEDLMEHNKTAHNGARRVCRTMAPPREESKIWNLTSISRNRFKAGNCLSALNSPHERQDVGNHTARGYGHFRNARRKRYARRHNPHVTSSVPDHWPRPQLRLLVACDALKLYGRAPVQRVTRAARSAPYAHCTWSGTDYVVVSPYSRL